MMGAYLRSAHEEKSTITIMFFVVALLKFMGLLSTVQA